MKQRLAAQRLQRGRPPRCAHCGREGDELCLDCVDDAVDAAREAIWEADHAAMDARDTKGAAVILNRLP